LDITRAGELAFLMIFRPNKRCKFADKEFEWLSATVKGYSASSVTFYYIDRW
jgi:predicted SprT family Zn-dependent metalloprotease